MVILAAEINGLFLKAGEWRCGFSEGGYYRDLLSVRRVEPVEILRAEAGQEGLFSAAYFIDL